MLVPAIEQAFKFDNTVLVEEAVPHALDIEVAVLGNHNPIISTPGQIVYEGEWYDFNAKYYSEKWDMLCPPRLPPTVIRQIQKLSGVVYGALGCAGGARVDWLVNARTGKICFSEINTVPTFRRVSVFPTLLAKKGLAYSRVIERLISLALERHRAENRKKYALPGGDSWFKI